MIHPTALFFVPKGRLSPANMSSQAQRWDHCTQRLQQRFLLWWCTQVLIYHVSVPTEETHRNKPSLLPLLVSVLIFSRSACLSIFITHCILKGRHRHFEVVHCFVDFAHLWLHVGFFGTVNGRKLLLSSWLPQVCKIEPSHAVCLTLKRSPISSTVIGRHCCNKCHEI